MIINEKTKEKFIWKLFTITHKWGKSNFGNISFGAAVFNVSILYNLKHSPLRLPNCIIVFYKIDLKSLKNGLDL